MSRIGKAPIPVPEGIGVSVGEGNLVAVTGPKGNLEQGFSPVVSIVVTNGEVVVTKADESRFSQVMQGTARAIVANMVKGVTEGFSKDLEIKGVGFRATLNGNKLDLELGYSHSIQYEILEGVTVTIEDNVKVHVEGADKQKVGQVAADIKSYYPVEPYKGKGVRIVGEFVRRKEGKKTA